MRRIPSASARCQAIVKWVHNDRCERKAVEQGLCAQHGKHGATVPDSWKHWRNDYGVLCAAPLGERRYVRWDER